MDVKVTYRTRDSGSMTCDAAVGLSLMDCAVRHGVPGILGECGGACACATCRVEIDAEWRGLTGLRSEIEEDLLSGFDNLPDGTRLSCQILVTKELDGLTLAVPAVD
jgi:2Fe-2S ferredoxin